MSRLVYASTDKRRARAKTKNRTPWTLCYGGRRDRERRKAAALDGLR